MIINEHVDMCASVKYVVVMSRNGNIFVFQFDTKARYQEPMPLFLNELNTIRKSFDITKSGALH
jgi:hypothetical protein